MNRRVLITGANGALGLVASHYFLSKGYAVTAVLSSMDKRSLFPENPLLELLAVDLTDEAATAALVETQINLHPELEGVLLLAGGFAMGSLSTTDDAALLQQYKLNFLTAYHVARPAYHYFEKAGRGRLVFVGARPALLASAGKDMSAYALSKSLLFRLAEQINAASKKHDITATVIVPSTIDTAANRQAMPDANFADWVSPEHIAGVMEWLFSASASVLREPVLKLYNKA
ncbi:MAG: SDR family NAD(P)-dependent oxidoreductase [Bacteroidetes bacterium]|nr:SDR family NAD(P)-dependent oxidoreductase [Bacteroidota bacterium]